MILDNNNNTIELNKIIYNYFFLFIDLYSQKQNESNIQILIYIV